jgi:hypothetical protein
MRPLAECTSAGLAVLSLFLGGCGSSSSQTVTAVRAGTAGATTARGWSTLETATTGDVEIPVAAADERGDLAAAWVRTVLHNGSPLYFVLATVRPAGGRWETPHVLSKLGSNPDIAAGAKAAVVAVWEQFVPPFAVYGERWRGHWSHPFALSSGAGSDPQVAVNSSGVVIAAWAKPRLKHALSRSDRGIQVSLALPGAAFQKPLAISASENAFNPRLAIDSRGDAAVAWEVDTASGCMVRAAIAPGGGPWTAPKTLSDATAGCPAAQRVSIDGAGHATVAWLAQRGPTTFLEWSGGDKSGRWSRRRSLASGNEVDYPQIAENARGDTIIAWAQTRGNDFVIKAASRTPAAPWRLSQIPKAAGLSAQVAIDERGDAIVGWQGPPLSETSARPVHGRWQMPQPLTSRTRGGLPVMLSIDARGTAFAILTERNLLASTVRSSGFR